MGARIPLDPYIRGEQPAAAHEVAREVEEERDLFDIAIGERSSGVGHEGTPCREGTKDLAGLMHEGRLEGLSRPAPLPIAPTMPTFHATLPPIENLLNAKIPLNQTRYVQLSRNGFVTLQDAVDQNLVPRPQLLTAGDKTFPQVCPGRISTARDDWYWAFGFWLVLEEGKRVGFSQSTHAPQVEMHESQVTSLAVYSLAGGNIQDEEGWSIQALQFETGLPLLSSFVESVTDEGVSTNLASGFISTKLTNQLITAKEAIAPPFYFHLFRNWTNLSEPPLPGYLYNPFPRNLAVKKGTSGVAIAWYELNPNPGRVTPEGRTGGFDFGDGDPFGRRTLELLEGMRTDVNELRRRIDGIEGAPR